MDARSCSLTPSLPSIVLDLTLDSSWSRVASVLSRIMLAGSTIMPTAIVYKIRIRFAAPPKFMEPSMSLIQLGDRDVAQRDQQRNRQPIDFPTTQSTRTARSGLTRQFHGEVVALACDGMSLALFELGSISERRIDQMLDPCSQRTACIFGQQFRFGIGLHDCSVCGRCIACRTSRPSIACSAFFDLNLGWTRRSREHGRNGGLEPLDGRSYRLAEIIACEALVACEASRTHQAVPLRWLAALHTMVRSVAPVGR